LTPVIFTAVADPDVTRAALWYEAQREGLGIRWLERADEAVRNIEVNPTG
jgi:hypothetical protein